jgi:hypothetical protein
MPGCWHDPAAVTLRRWRRSRRGASDAAGVGQFAFAAAAVQAAILDLVQLSPHQLMCGVGCRITSPSARLIRKAVKKPNTHAGPVLTASSSPNVAAIQSAMNVLTWGR